MNRNPLGDTMNKDNRNQLRMFGRVVKFGAAHTEQFPDNSLGGRTFAALNSARTRAEAFTASQAAGRASARQAAAWKAAAVEALHHTVDAMIRTAEAIALDTPGVDKEFQPAGDKSTDALLETASAFAARAVPLSAAFIEHDMPATFTADLNACIQNLQRAIEKKEDGRKAHMDATAEITSAIQDGFDSIQRLDAIVRNKLAGDPSGLAEWERVRHLDRPNHRVEAGSTDQDPGPTTTPPAAAPA